MRALLCLLFGFSASAATNSEATFPFQFRSAQVVDVLQQYGKMTGQTFVIDEPAGGKKITILSTHKVNAEEAFNLLSTALATIGIGISTHGDVLVVQSARSLQRDLIPVTTELPPINPEKMISWIYETKYFDAEEVVRELRLIPSRDGEVYPFGKNKVIISDWVSNLHRVHDLLVQVDQPRTKSEKK